MPVIGVTDYTVGDSLSPGVVSCQAGDVPIRLVHGASGTTGKDMIAERR